MAKRTLESYVLGSKSPVCHLLKVKVTQSCLTLYDPMDYIVHGILQAQILEWGAFSFSRGSFSTQGSNPGHRHCRWILYQPSHQGSPLPLITCEFEQAA